VPGLVGKHGNDSHVKAIGTMMTDRDRKTYWDLFETVCWICSRDEEKVAAMWGMSDQGKLGLVIAGMKVQMVIHSPPGPSGSTRGAIMATVAPEANELAVEAQDAFEALLRKVHSRRVRMTAINCHDTHERQIEVPLAELNDLELRMIPDYQGVGTGLWSRSSDALAWRSPQFLRADVIGAWPAPKTKTATVPAAILRHLRQIMTPEAGLTKPEARQRCLAEVPNAYLAAFNRAWGQLEVSYKRGRGKHGKRVR
jgi:hypothetical protein